MHTFAEAQAPAVRAFAGFMCWAACEARRVALPFCVNGLYRHDGQEGDHNDKNVHPENSTMKVRTYAQLEDKRIKHENAGHPRGEADNDVAVSWHRQAFPGMTISIRFRYHLIGALQKSEKTS